MDFSLQDQFKGFIHTPQIFAQNAIFGYPLFDTLPTRNYDLEELTEPGTRVLGKRMEHFFHYYITHFNALSVLAHNRQIIRHKHTLGELDFLLKDLASKQVSHIELIYKFYLYDPDCGTSEKDHLIGSNRRDSLNLKLERLQKRQFPLLFHPATQELLNELKIAPQHVLQKICFKASVFLPKHRQDIAFSEINPGTVRGYWIHVDEFTSEEYRNQQFFSPRKNYWPVNPEKNSTWFSHEEILAQINPRLEDEFSPLLWMKLPNGRLEQFFVVWW